MSGDLLAALRSVRDIVDFDQRITAPRNGYDSAAECDAAVQAGNARFYRPVTDRKPARQKGEASVRTIRLSELSSATAQAAGGPPASVIAKVAEATGLSPEQLTFIYAPTQSLAGSTQVVARVLGGPGPDATPDDVRRGEGHVP